MSAGEQAVVSAEHRMAFEAVAFARHMLTMHDPALTRLIRSAELMESAGIAIDPTLLRSYIHSKNAQAQVRIARLVVKFLADLGREVAALPPEAADAAEGRR